MTQTEYCPRCQGITIMGDDAPDNKSWCNCDDDDIYDQYVTEQMIIEQNREQYE